VAASAVPTAHATEVDPSTVFTGQATCTHVINLMLRHGIDDSNRKCHTNQLSVFHPSVGSFQLTGVDVGDLELISVERCEDSADATHGICGPTFAVVIQNNSTRCVENFRTSVVALRGSIHHHCPTAVAKVGSIAAGQAIEVRVTLPESCLDMGRRGAEALPLSRLLVAIDSLDQFYESNEVNNVKVFDVASIPMLTTTVVTESTTEQTPLTDSLPSSVGTDGANDLGNELGNGLESGNTSGDGSGGAASDLLNAPNNAQSTDQNALPADFDINQLDVDATQASARRR